MSYHTTPKMAERKLARRQRILQAAIRLFGVHGYHATTIPMVVAESNGSTGSFYFYFKNKEDVFAAALESLGERLAATLNEAIGQAPDPFRQMQAAVIRLFLFLAAHPDEARILIVESSGLSGRLEHIRRRILASHARSVEQALLALGPALPVLDPQVSARCWVGAAFEALYHWLELAPAERPRAEQVAAAVARFNLRAIGAPPELWS